MLMSRCSPGPPFGAVPFLALLFIVGCSRGYQKEGGEWAYVWWDAAHGRNVVKLGADKATFKVLNDEYAKDKNTVFYKTEKIRDADPATFELMSDPIYTRDAFRVFVFGHAIAGADPRSFTIIKPPYARDATTVYCGNVPMDVANVDAFEPVLCGTSWSFTYTKPFHAGRPEAFGHLEIGPDKPAVTGTAWARDGVSYYYGPLQVEDADYASFRILDEYTAVDNQRTYQGAFPSDAFAERRKQIRGAD